MRIAEFKALKPLDIESMTTPQLRKALSGANSTARKRQKRIDSADEVYSPAVDYINRTGGFKPVKGQSREELINNITRTQKFLKSETSTLKGAREYTQEQKLILAENTGLNPEEIDDLFNETQKTKFWSVLDEAVDNKQIAKGSEEFYRAQKILAQDLKQGDKRRGKDYYYNRLIENLEVEYREQQRNLVSDRFE